MSSCHTLPTAVLSCLSHCDGLKLSETRVQNQSPLPYIDCSLPGIVVTKKKKKKTDASNIESILDLHRSLQIGEREAGELNQRSGILGYHWL